MAGSPGSVPVEASQVDARLVLDPADWKLGHDLIGRHEYGRAAEYFRRTLLSAEASVDRLFAEAAQVAVELCDALSCGRSVEEKLRDALGVLSQDLSRLSYEEVSLARGALTARPEAGPSAAHPASSTPAPYGATATMVEEALPPAGATVHVAPRPCLRVNFLGRFELLRDGEVMHLGRNTRALSILKYLIVYRGDRPVSRDYLLGWMWPESDTKRAYWSLNSAIYALRRLLGRCLPFLPAPETVLLEGGGYRLSPRVLLSTDVDEFDSLCEEGRRLEKAGREPEAIPEYEKAAKLYRGDYMIEDLYEEWTMIERERLAAAYADTLHQLAGYYSEIGRYQESIRVCYRILKKDNCHEGSYRRLMECYVRVGSKNQALRQYRVCEEILRRSYDVTPSPETQALYERLSRGVAT